jgi:hypothetical protein
MLLWIIPAKVRRFFGRAILASLLLSISVVSVRAQERGITVKLPRIELSPVQLAPSWITPAPTARPVATPEAGGAGWIPVDSITIHGTVAAGQAWQVRADHATGRLFAIIPDPGLGAEALAAIAAAPAWLRDDLSDNLRRLPAGVQRDFAARVSSADDRTRDEVAFAVAHLSPYTLAQMDSRIVQLNANGIYAVAPDLHYVRLVEHGSAPDGD